MFIKCPICFKDIQIDKLIIDKYSYFLDDGIYKNGERWDKIRKDIINVIEVEGISHHFFTCKRNYLVDKILSI